MAEPLYYQIIIISGKLYYLVIYSGLYPHKNKKIIKGENYVEQKIFYPYFTLLFYLYHWAELCRML